MNDVNKLKEQYSGKYPGFGSYLECMTRALFTGLAALGLGASSAYIPQSMLKSYLPYGNKGILASSLICGVLAGAFVTAHRTKGCQAMWMAVEDKHTALTNNLHNSAD